VPVGGASAAQRCPRVARAPDAMRAPVTVGATLVANGVRAQARSHRKSLHALATRWFRGACQARSRALPATEQPAPPSRRCVCARTRLALYSFRTSRWLTHD